MKLIDGDALMHWLDSQVLPDAMLMQEKDTEDVVLRIMRHVTEMQAADCKRIAPHMAPSDGTEPLGVLPESKKDKPHPRGQVNWTADMFGPSKDYLNWKLDMVRNMWSLWWFEESRKMRTDLSPEDVEASFDILRREAAVWVRMATQMNAGQRGSSGDLNFWNGNAERTAMNIIIQVCHLALHNVFGPMPEYINDDIRERESP